MLTLVAAVVSAATANVPATPAYRSSRLVPVQLHAVAGWGRPAVDAATIYYLSQHHEIVAVDRTTAAERWRRPLNAGSGPPSGMSVVVHGDAVIAGDYDLFAFDRRSGRLRWRFTPTVGHAPGPYLGMAAAGAVFAGSASGRIYAVDVITGLPRWQSAALGPRVTMFGPVVDGDQVIAAFTDFGASPRGGGVVALHAVDGSLRWQVRFPRLGGRPAASAAGGPIVVRDLVAAASSDGTVYAFDRASGRVRWTVPPVARDPPHKAPEEPLTARNENAVSGAVGETEDVRPLASSRREIFAGSLSGVLCALEASTGRERWRFSSPSDGSIAFGITASGSVVYVPFASGRLVAVDSATGRKLWHAGGPEHRFEWPPVVGHHRAYLTTEDGLYAVAHHSN